MAAVDLPSGTMHYHQCGSGAPIVFLHGYLMGANLWDPVIHLLDHEFRCITPELPMGAHPTPIRPDADLTTAGLGRLAGILPDARLELIGGSRTWVMRDQPQRSAHLIGQFARRTATTQAT